jgi:ribokinase
VSFYGKVGKDFFGKELLQSLLGNRAHVKAVEQEHGVSSGITSILVAEDGENAIVYVPGANALMDATYVDLVLPELAAAKGSSPPI